MIKRVNISMAFKTYFFNNESFRLFCSSKPSSSGATFDRVSLNIILATPIFQAKMVILQDAHFVFNNEFCC